MKRSSYWYIRLLTERKARPLYVGLVTAAALLLIYVIWAALLDWEGRGVHFSVASLGVELAMIMWTSFSIGVTLDTLNTTPRDVLALAPALALDEKSLSREAATITEQSSAIYIWTLCWAIATIVLTWSVSQMPLGDNALLNALSQSNIAGWLYFRNLIFGFALSQLVWITIALARRLGKLLEEHGKVNLLDRSGFQALAKRARRSILSWIPLLILTSFSYAVLIAVVILPATGIRRRYVEEKNLQLEKVRARIADRSAAVVDDSFTPESSNLPELLSWEQRLQQTKVWPYEMTTYLRVFFYAGIGLASWIGAAFVERFISALLG